MKKKGEKIKKINLSYWIIVTVIIVIIIFFLVVFSLFTFFKIPKTANEFGDSFGIANAIFSALAFAFLIVTALMQRKELELQREELHENRLELKRSVRAQDATQEALNVQVSIMSKQALLASYQSLYQSNIDVSNNKLMNQKVRGEAESEAIKYMKKIKESIYSIELDMEFMEDTRLSNRVGEAVRAEVTRTLNSINGEPTLDIFEANLVEKIKKNSLTNDKL